MMDQLSNAAWIFVLLGIFAGLIGGALGLGGGTIIVPTLVLFCSFTQKSAQGTALAVMVPMALVGALRYWRNPEIEINALPVVLIMCGALVGVLFGTELASRLPGHVLRKVFATVLIIVAIKLLMTSPKPMPDSLDNNLSEQKTLSVHDHGKINNESDV
jgi:uncharacterized membrane protein YfcA